MQPFFLEENVASAIQKCC